MSNKKDNQNVLVGVRIRPRNEKEITANMPVFFHPDTDSQNVQELDENGVVIKHWGFDQVFGPESTNKEIFENMGLKLVDGALEGYNTVMFMYGQTSSGKTFTLFGDHANLGVVDHAMEYLMQRVKSSADTEYVIKLTYAELYNEELRDLLSSAPNENLKIIDDPNLGPMIQNITEASFTSASEIRNYLDEGERRRHFGITNMNAHSSRSHVIVRLGIESRKVPYKPRDPLRQSWGKDRPNCISTLNLVDLAGSERANKAGTSGQSLKEGSFINRSLLTLGTVISNLSEGKLQHIPYRNSKLTRLLATALGGNAKTCVITCISPASGNLGESLNTLRFASRAKRVVNHVQKNEIMDMKTLTNKLAFQMMEIENLRAQLEMSRQLGYLPDEEETQSGETLREKAIMVSKYWRSLRFFLVNGKKIMDTLRSKGLLQEVKQFPKDLRALIFGQRDVQEVLEDYAVIFQTAFTKDRNFLVKIQEILTHNESEIVVNMNTVFDTMTPEDADEEDSRSGDKKKSDSGPLTNQELTDLFSLLEESSDEMKELFENQSFGKEELIMLFHLRQEQYQQEVIEWHHKERQQKKLIEELQETIIDKNELVKMTKQNEQLLLRQLEDVNNKWKSDVIQSQETIQELSTKLAQAEVRQHDQEGMIFQLQQEVSNKDFLIEKYKIQLEQSQSELQKSQQLRKNVEEESNRQRGEMRLQMERLRNNMHELLRQGGEEAKVIESHNVQLQHEMDTLKDEFKALQFTKQQLEVENDQLRSQLTLTMEDLKANHQSLTMIKEEKNDLLNKLREDKLELTKYLSTISFLQQNNQQLEQEKQAEGLQLNELLQQREEEISNLNVRHKQRLHELQNEMEMKELERVSLLDQLQGKQQMLNKFETSYSHDLSRVEKKLSQQTKMTEELIQEKQSLLQQHHLSQQKLLEELRVMKQRNQELQQTIDSINSYVEEKEKELLVEGEDGNTEEERGSPNRRLSSTGGDDTVSIIQGSYLSHSLQQQQQQKEKKSLSRYASRFYMNDNGKVMNNFNSYYDLNSFYSSAPTTLNSDDEEKWSDDASISPNQRDGSSGSGGGGGGSSRSRSRIRNFSMQSEDTGAGGGDEYEENSDDVSSLASNTPRNSLLSTVSEGNNNNNTPVSKLEKIKQFHEYYSTSIDKDTSNNNHHTHNNNSSHNGNKRDEYDFPLVHIEGSLSVSADISELPPPPSSNHSEASPIRTQHPFSPTPSTDNRNYNNSLPSGPPSSSLKKKTINNNNNNSNNSQPEPPFSTPKGVKFRSTSQHDDSGGSGGGRERNNALTITTSSSWSPTNLPLSPTAAAASPLQLQTSPIQPVLSFQDDPRLQQQLQEYEKQHSELYESVYYGLSLSTLMLESIYHDQRLHHQVSQLSSQQTITQTLAYQTQIETLLIDKESLYEKNQQLIQSYQFLQEKHQALSQVLSELETKYYQLSRDYHQVIHSERLKQSQFNALEENMMSERVKLDKYQLEIHKHQSLLYENKVNLLTLQSEKEVLEEKLLVMESQLHIVTQEKEILTVERDELLKRFLPSLLSKSALLTNNSTTTTDTNGSRVTLGNSSNVTTNNNPTHSRNTVSRTTNGTTTTPTHLTNSPLTHQNSSTVTGDLVSSYRR